MEKTIKIQAIINSPVEKVWEYYTSPKHIVKWNSASKDWHTTKSINDLRVNGKFSSRMESIDGNQGFDFEGTYNEIKIYHLIKYTMSDQRIVKITFISNNNKTTVIIEFNPEQENPIEYQRDGWQAILNNFKKYVESN